MNAGRFTVLLTAAGLVAFTACGTTSHAGTISLNGAGATFPYPLYSKWSYEYNKIHPDVQINYQSIGSGGGIKQISERTVDFAGSDAIVSDEALAKLPAKLLHIPMTLGAVVLSYNVEGLSGLKLAPEVVSKIFLGEITKWNDPAIAGLNPGASLPDAAINVVHRSDGSGTTNVFTNYLSAVSPSWKEKVGAGTSVNWPVGLGAKGNEGVAGQVKGTPGAIGYVELVYARQNKMPYALLKNAAGAFVEPTLESVSAAAAMVKVPEDFRVSIVNAPGEKSYPISAFSWILLYDRQDDPVKGKSLVDFLAWGLADGQKFGPDLGYAPLPADLVQKAQAALRTVTANGAPLLGK